ncbi:MAG: ATP-binding cassette domain-containing protein, partial [Bilophila sp.]
LTMGGLIACNILIGRAMAPLMQLSAMLSRYQQSRMALKALDALMDIPSENSAELPGVDFSNLAPSLTFENVSFSYPDAKQPSLKAVNLHISPGEKVGIIGLMGSGKSTLGKLAVGLYQPDQGTVRFGDVDIRQMDTADLRSRIGFLPQDVVLFFGTIHDNIALNDTTVNDRQVSRAVWASGVSDFIRNRPAGLGTQVGERGMQLSGGQRQSIALARALLHDPAVLVLDEPTSNMDTVTELLVRSRLQTLIADKTVVLITHHMNMLELVDRLIVMQDGGILADGPRQTVLAQLRGEKS